MVSSFNFGPRHAAFLREATAPEEAGRIGFDRNVRGGVPRVPRTCGYTPGKGASWPEEGRVLRNGRRQPVHDAAEFLCDVMNRVFERYLRAKDQVR